MWRLKIVKMSDKKWQVIINGELFGYIVLNQNDFPIFKPPTILIENELSLSTMKEIVDEWEKNIADVYGDNFK